MRVGPPAAAWAAFLLSFGSIAMLLAAMWRVAPMHVGALLFGLPSVLALAALFVWARRRGHVALDRAMVAGVWGGLWGTLGYDLIRIPFHLAGFNPFQPIRSYGMFVLDAPHATVWTDLAGALYHASNGLTFGVMYAMVATRRRWAWAILFALLLETGAVFTPFGAVYGLRANVTALAIAYFAHIYYGFPLGLAVNDPERLTRWVRRPRVVVATVAASVAVLAFLVGAWEPPAAARPAPGVVELGPDAIVSGWTRVPVDAPLVLQNADDAEVSWRLGGKSGTLMPGGRAELSFGSAGMLQLVVTDRPWRSAMVAVERDGYPAEPGTR